MQNTLRNLRRNVLKTGAAIGDRTGTDTTSVVGRQIRFDMAKGCPLIWTKKVLWPSVAFELFLFLGNMALSPCHALFQFHVAPGIACAPGQLSCQLYQRCADMFLGVPFNIASYALLTHMVAQQTGLNVGECIWTGGDVNVYDDHTDQVTEQLGRLEDERSYPELKFNRVPDPIFDYSIEDFEIVGYDPHPGIKAPVAV